MNINSSSSTGNPSGSTGVSGGGPCGACKFLRRKCVLGCVFAPYFDSEQGAAHFAAVHKVFGASNVSKLLLHIPVHKRPDAVLTICYEAQARLRDPVYGCVAHIFALNQQVVNLQAELSYLQAHLATVDIQQPPPPPLSIAGIPNISSAAATGTYDLSSMFDPSFQTPPWSSSSPSSAVATAGAMSHGGDLQAVAHELLRGGGVHHGSTGSALSRRKRG